MDDHSISIINDQHIYSGTYIHAAGIHTNLLNHNISSKFYQFSIQGKLDDLPPNTTVTKGFLYSKESKGSIAYKMSLGLNFISNRNWRIFKNIKDGMIILSGPTLLPLTKYYRNSIVLGHDLYFLDQKGFTLEGHHLRSLYKKFNDANTIIVNSNFTKSEFVKKLGVSSEKLFVTYPYVDMQAFHPGKSNIRDLIKANENDVLLLSVGGDNPNKNIETILHLLKKLPENFKLIRVGRNYRTNKLIRTLGLESRVFRMENVNREFLSMLYRGSDIFIFPSTSEGFGIPLIEAMASGIPIITSDRGSLPEVIDNMDLICDPLDIDNIESKILKINGEESFRNEIIEKELERVKAFSQEMQYKALKSVLNL